MPRTTTPQQDAAFLKEVIGSNILEPSLQWIKDNIEPEDLYEEQDLIDWAEQQEPGKLFDKATLEAWAEENGFKKQDE